MADDSRLRSYRSNDPYRRAEPAPPSEEANARDPLAELARLLGQSDPFAELGRSNRAPRQAHDAPPTAPANWQAAPARDVAPGDSRSRWALPSHQDYTPAPAAQNQPAASRYYDEPQLNAAPYDGYADEGGQGHQQEQEHQQDQHESQYYDQDGALEPHDDEAMYDDPPRVRRGSALPTALALIACAVVGTASAYAFRTFYGTGDATQPPPVITADNSTPTKIVPASDPQSGRSAQDRLASADKEQIISKQEEPVALKDLANQAAARVVLPPPVAPAQGAASPSASNEPKKIRTVPIRPDGGDASSKPVSGQAAAAANAAPRPGATPAAPKAAPARSNGPISLDPQSEPAAAPASRTRTAAAPPVATRAAPEVTESTSDGFMVQLSSQKSEAEAQSSFRSLQARFPNELNGLQPIIRRADLGSKGVFYRTMVGPFASVQEASQFCANYKAAGGQCVVPNN